MREGSSRGKNLNCYNNLPIISSDKLQRSTYVEKKKGEVYWLEGSFFLGVVLETDNFIPLLRIDLIPHFIFVRSYYWGDI